MRPQTGRNQKALSMRQAAIVAPRPDSDSDERELVERARTHSDAYAELYLNHVAAVFSYLRTYTSSEEDAADLTQHVFLRAFEALPNYRGQEASFRTWLFRIARNAATDRYRRQRWTLAWDRVPESVHPRSPSDPEAATLHREALTQVHLLVAQLSPEKQELLALRFAAGLSSGEIAGLVGKSPAAVQKELVRIMHFLREQVRDAAE